jgi:excisionase family DNA binding protein
MSAQSCYTTAEICERLKMPLGTFRNLKTQGKLPFLDELKPRLGKTVRYRADLVDRYLAGQWGQSRFFRRHA